MSEQPEPTPKPESNEANPAPTEPKPEPVATVSRAEFDTVTQALASVTASLQALATARQEPYSAPAQTHETPITEADIAAELQEGKTGKLMTFVNRAVEKVRKEEVEPLRHQGTAALASIARQTAINSGTMPYLDKFKKDVDAAFEKLPLVQRTTPEAYQACYQFVIGSRTQDIVKEETEKAIRQGRAATPESQPPASGGRAAATTPEGKTAMAQIFDEDATVALREQGKTPDEFARKMGYKSAEDYALFAVKQRGASA